MTNPKILALITIILWSFGATLGRLISLKSHFLFLAISFLFSFLAILVYTYFSDKYHFIQKIKKIRFKYFVFGLFGYFIYSLALNFSFQSYNSASEATILNYTWPLFTVLFTDLFFRRHNKSSIKIHTIESVGMMFGLLAIIIFITRGNIFSFDVSNVKGLSLGLLAGGSYGFFSAFSSTIPKKDHGIFLLCSIFSSLLVMIPLSFSELSLIPTITINDVLVVAAVGIIINGVGYISWTRANRIAKEKDVNISSIASLVYFLPVLSLIIVTVSFKEKSIFHPYFLMVLFLLLIGSIVCQKASVLANKI